jgi:hypothetical protein
MPIRRWRAYDDTTAHDAPLTRAEVGRKFVPDEVRTEPNVAPLLVCAGTDSQLCAGGAAQGR